MGDRFTELVGPERFEFILALVGIGLPVAIVLLMIWVGTTGLPFVPSHSQEDDESKKVRRDSDWDAETGNQPDPSPATDD